MTDESGLLTEIHHLKQQYRKAKWIDAILAISIVALIVLGRMQSKAPSKASEFLLEDSMGTITARLFNDVHGPCLELMSKDDSAGALLCVDNANGAELNLTANHGQSRVFLSPGGPVYEGGGRLLPSITVTSKDNYLSATPDNDTALAVVRGVGRIQFSVPTNGRSTIRFDDKSR